MTFFVKLHHVSRHYQLELASYEGLGWNQIWTSQFQMGAFFHTESITDTVVLSSTGVPGDFYATGIYTSMVFDATRLVDWGQANWRHIGQAQAVTLRFRTGNDLPIDEGWSDWLLPSNPYWGRSCWYEPLRNESACTTDLYGVPSSRYLQYEATLESEGPGRGVQFDDFGLICGVHSSSGVAVTKPIRPWDLRSWSSVTWAASTPESTQIRVDVLSEDGDVLMFDVRNGDSLFKVDASVHRAVRLRVSMSTSNVAVTPVLNTWGLQWQTLDLQFLPVLMR